MTKTTQQLLQAFWPAQFPRLVSRTVEAQIAFIKACYWWVPFNDQKNT